MGQNERLEPHLILRVQHVSTFLSDRAIQLNAATPVVTARGVNLFLALAGRLDEKKGAQR